MDRCISQSLPSDLFIKGNEICYVVYPERCIAADFCPEIQVQIKFNLKPYYVQQSNPF